MEPPTIFVKPRAPEASALASSMHPYLPDILPVMFGPNISGTFTVYTAYAPTENKNGATGSFYLSDGGGQGESSVLAGTRPKWNLSASRSSSVYGESSSVQPPSLRVLPCIKL